MCRAPVSKWSFSKLHEHDNSLSPTTPERKVDAETILTKLIERGSRVVVDLHENTLDQGNGGSMEPPLEEGRLTELQARWDSLLDARPQSTESIADWVEQVLDVSYLAYYFDEGASNHSSRMENGKAAATEQSQQVDTDEESQQESGEHGTTRINSSSNDLHLEINQRVGTWETSDRQTTNVDSAMKTAGKPLYESQTSGATNVETDNRGQFDDASTSSDESLDLRAKKHKMASN